MTDRWDREFKSFEDRPLSTLFKWGAGILVLSVGLGVVGSCVGLFGKAISAPSRVANRMLETDNIIDNYEWYYDTNAQFEARTLQLSSWLPEYKAATDPAERSRLRVEVQAIEQSCRNLATQYNANAQKLTRSVFRGWSLPESLDVTECDL